MLTFLQAVNKAYNMYSDGHDILNISNVTNLPNNFVKNMIWYYENTGEKLVTSKNAKKEE